MFAASSLSTAAAILLAAAVAALAGPSVAAFLAAEIPKVYESLLSWLAPPYLYLIINGIILSIAASSRFTKPPLDAEPAPPEAAELVADVAVPPPEVEELAAEAAAPEPVTAEVVEVKGEEEEDGFAISKPLVLERFGNRRIKASTEGKALRRLSATRPKRNDTLESTWRTITEGRAVPLARHLKKSDTYDGCSEVSPSSGAAVMRKSETFNASRPSPSSPMASPGSGGMRLRREPSLGQDELNRRVEAFIRKFNEEMRLQRQESFKHYAEMMNRR